MVILVQIPNRSLRTIHSYSFSGRFGPFVLPNTLCSADCVFRKPNCPAFKLLITSSSAPLDLSLPIVPGEPLAVLLVKLECVLAVPVEARLVYSVPALVPPSIICSNRVPSVPPYLCMFTLKLSLSRQLFFGSQLFVSNNILLRFLR